MWLRSTDRKVAKGRRQIALVALFVLLATSLVLWLASSGEQPAVPGVHHTREPAAGAIEAATLTLYKNGTSRLVDRNEYDDPLTDNVRLKQNRIDDDREHSVVEAVLLEPPFKEILPHSPADRQTTSESPETSDSDETPSKQVTATTPVSISPGHLSSEQSAQTALPLFINGNGNGYPETPGFRFYGSDDGNGSNPRLEIAGLIINGREIPEGLAILVQSKGQRMLPLAEIAPHIGSELKRDNGTFYLLTPLGRAPIPMENIQRFRNEIYISLDDFSSSIAARTNFDEKQYAIRLQLLWNPLPALPGLHEKNPIRPDKQAPGASLSRIRGEARLEHNRQDTRESGFVETEGRLGIGIWGARYIQPSNRQSYWEDYNWRAKNDQWATLIGHQRLGIHPLMPGFDLTGAQLAWSSHNEELLISRNHRTLVNDRLSPIRDFEGEGPPGGLAELQIDGLIVARQRITLDGIFLFPGVSVPPGLKQIEVVLYEPFARTPVDVLDFSERVSDQLLSPGISLIHGGIGQDGNPLADSVAEDSNAGFLTARHGLSRWLTLDAAFQTANDSQLFGTGLTANLGVPGVASTALAQDENGHQTMQARLEGDKDNWFWRGSSRRQDREFANRSGPSTLIEHQGEAGLIVSASLQVSLVGRYQRNGEKISFIKPAARARPRQDFTLQARPDAHGDYRYDLWWYINRDTRFSASQTESQQRADISHRITSRWRTAVGLNRNRESGDTGTDFLLGYRSLDPYGWWADASVGVNGNSRNYNLRLGRELIPGVRGRLQTRRNVPSSGPKDPRGTEITASINFDLGRAGGSFTRAGGNRLTMTGNIGGELSGLPSDYPGTLQDVAIRIDGQGRGRTDSNGRFHVQGLRPGVYRVELDSEGLPMELSPSHRSYWVEVAAGATSNVDFEVLLLLGAAGRVFDATGNNLSGGTITILDTRDEPVATTTINRFGYYRVDGLSPGQYQLVIHTVDGQTTESLTTRHSFTLINDFLFGIDVHLSPDINNSETTAPSSKVTPNNHATDDTSGGKS